MSLALLCKTHVLALIDIFFVTKFSADVKQRKIYNSTYHWQTISYTKKHIRFDRVQHYTPSLTLTPVPWVSTVIVEIGRREHFHAILFKLCVFPDFFFTKCVEDISPFGGTTDTPHFVLGFKARVDPCLHVSLLAYNEFLRFTFGATPTDLLVAYMAAEPFLIHVLAHVFRSWPCSMRTRRNGSLTLT